ncbi:sensor histidine kinase [Streptomyces syringium]|uniref:sensor histidine kinase n=1 Tax=Streptomyces syringium TaxID=76729 RepID=UPI00364BABDF
MGTIMGERMTSAMTRHDTVLAAGTGVPACAAAAVAALAHGVHPVAALSTAWAPALALWALLCRPPSRRRLALPVTAAAVLSLVSTFAVTPDRTDGGWGSYGNLVEAGALAALLTVVVRRSPARHVPPAGLVVGAAVSLWTWPLVPSLSFLAHVGAAAFWSLPVLGAVVAGGYPRWAERRGRGWVRDARRAQQLEIARDLHDFIAHDVSGIVAQAQAARFVAASAPEQALPALRRIEKAGLNALESMDRMVRMLHDDTWSDGAAPPGGAPHGVDPLPGPGQLAGLIERFSAADGPQAYLALDPGAADALSRDVGSTAYRVVVEALTNVRRHAPRATRVDVVLTAAGEDTVEVRVSNDAGAKGQKGPATRWERDERHGGHGLRGLRERVRVAGGSLSAGPRDGGGWHVVAVLPRAPGPLRTPDPLHAPGSSRTPDPLRPPGSLPDTGPGTGLPERDHGRCDHTHPAGR